MYIKKIEIFRVMNCTENKKVNYVLFMFVEEVGYWQNSIGDYWKEKE